MQMFLEVAEREQVVVAGDEEIGLGGDGGRDDPIVISMRRDHRRRRERRHQLDGIDIIGDYLMGDAAEEGQPLRGNGADQDLAQFRQ